MNIKLIRNLATLMNVISDFLTAFFISSEVFKALGQILMTIKLEATFHSYNISIKYLPLLSDRKKYSAFYHFIMTILQQLEAVNNRLYLCHLQGNNVICGVISLFKTHKSPVISSIFVECITRTLIDRQKGLNRTDYEYI